MLIAYQGSQRAEQPKSKSKESTKISERRHLPTLKCRSSTLHLSKSCTIDEEDALRPAGVRGMAFLPTPTTHMRKLTFSASTALAHEPWVSDQVIRRTSCSHHDGI